MNVSVKSNKSDKAAGFILELRRKNKNITKKLDMLGQMGCQRLTYATPFDTGETAMSWSYELTRNQYGYSINFMNSHIENGVNIAVILQTGHPTRNGGWVEGRDYINPALQPIFDEIAEKAWGEIKAI